MYLSSHLRILQVGLRIAGGKLGDLPDLYTVSVCLHTDASTRIEALRDTCNALWFHSSMQRWVSRKPLQTLLHHTCQQSDTATETCIESSCQFRPRDQEWRNLRMMFVARHCGSSEKPMTRPQATSPERSPASCPESLQLRMTSCTSGEMQRSNSSEVWLGLAQLLFARSIGGFLP